MLQKKCKESKEAEAYKKELFMGSFFFCRLCLLKCPSRKLYELLWKAKITLTIAKAGGKQTYERKDYSKNQK